MSKEKLSAEALNDLEKIIEWINGLGPGWNLFGDVDRAKTRLQNVKKKLEQLQMEKECLKWEIEEFKEVVKEVADRCRHNAAHIEDDPDMRQAWKENAEDLEALLTPKPEK